MNNYKSIVGRQYPANLSFRYAFLAFVFVVTGCGTTFPGNSTLLSGFSEVTYESPPKPQSYLQPQSGMVICEEAQAAIAMALTGFFLDSCALLQRSQTWRVISVTYRDLGNGQTLWLTEVESKSTGDELPVTRWAPIPWHNWA